MVPPLQLATLNDGEAGALKELLRGASLARRQCSALQSCPDQHARLGGTGRHSCNNAARWGDNHACFADPVLHRAPACLLACLLRCLCRRRQPHHAPGGQAAAPAHLDAVCAGPGAGCQQGHSVQRAQAVCGRCATRHHGCEWPQRAQQAMPGVQHQQQHAALESDCNIEFAFGGGTHHRCGQLSLTSGTALHRPTNQQPSAPQHAPRSLVRMALHLLPCSA